MSKHPPCSELSGKLCPKELNSLQSLSQVLYSGAGDGYAKGPLETSVAHKHV